MRYHGGKWRLAPWIISHFPPHRVYVEPFGGAGSVLLRKPRAYAEVYNDRWDTVVNVFRVLRDPELARRLTEMVALTPFSRSEFESAGEPSDDPVEQARRTIYRSLAGFGSAAANGRYATGFRANSNRSHTTPAMDWRNYPPLIAAYVERLRGVIVENRDAASVMQQHDGIETLHYVDPPYVLSTRKARCPSDAARQYAHNLSDGEHADLAEALHDLEGMVVLSGYPSALYDELYGDWMTIDKEALADGARPRVERLWMNPACQQALAGQIQMEAAV